VILAVGHHLKKRNCDIQGDLCINPSPMTPKRIWKWRR